MPYKRGKGENEEVISRVEDFSADRLKAQSPLAVNEFACSAYRGALTRPAEREIKPAQKCGD